jgi:hypothetical protein
MKGRGLAETRQSIAEASVLISALYGVMVQWLFIRIWNHSTVNSRFRHSQVRHTFYLAHKILFNPCLVIST